MSSNPLRFSLVALAWITALPLASTSRAQSTQAVSLDSNGDLFNQESSAPSISANGRVVAFYSRGPGSTASPGCEIFVHNRLRFSTELVSADPQGQPSNVRECWIDATPLSADGRWIAFVSRAPNLVDDDTNGVSDVFVRDLRARRTERVRLDGLFEDPSAVEVSRPALSGDGRWLVFQAFTVRDGRRALLLDRSTGAIRDVGLGNDGERVTAFSPSISENGQFVSFFSNAFDEESEELRTAVLVRDLRAETTEIASLDPRGRVLEAEQYSTSADGRRLLFLSGEETPNGEFSLRAFLRDLDAGTTREIDLGQIEGSPELVSATISGNGRFALLGVDRFDFTTSDLLVLDLERAGVQIVNLDPQDRLRFAETRAEDTAISHDGTQVAFVSFSSGLVPRDFDAAADVFVRDLRAQAVRPARIELESRLGNVFPTGFSRLPIRAHVTDARGEPVVGAPVSFLSVGVSGTQSAVLDTDASGRVEFLYSAGFSPGRDDLTAVVRDGSQPRATLTLQVVPGDVE